MRRFLCIIVVFHNIFVQAQHVVRYDLFINDTSVNYAGKIKKAIAANGQIPMPTLYFTEGDTAEIYVHNRMHHETSIHWHGILLPNEQDGVPYLTTAPIKPNTTHFYRFPIKQSGTFWYHSHTMLQEQSGMYGAFIIRKKNESIKKEEVILLSDWTNENPKQIERSLHYGTDWYPIKKGATQNYAQAVKERYLKTKLNNEWKRMHAMDVSDVYYDRFLINGLEQLEKKEYKAGEKIRLRVINGSSSSYFWLRYSGGKITVIASDGADVEPIEVDRLIIGVAETYDVIVTIPNDSVAYEFNATAEDRSGSISLWLGNGKKQPSPQLQKLNYFEGMKMMNGMMTMSGNMKDMGMNMGLQKMDMNQVMYPEINEKQKIPITLNYNMLKSPKKTTLPNVPFRTYNFELTGNMFRYVWTINNKTVSETDKLLIKAGENIRIIITNNTMMRHPMHLHGHYFRVLNKYGEYAPLKNVLDIMPMETDTIEFNAMEEYGDWYFHCHILYHMMSGMSRIFYYENSPPNQQLPKPGKALRKVYSDDRRFYLGAKIGLESNGSEGEIALMNTRWKLQAEWRLGLNKKSGYETESHIGRFMGKNQFLFLYTGWDLRYREEQDDTETNAFNKKNTKDDREVFCLGLLYKLPFHIIAGIRIDDTGYTRLEIGRQDIPVTARLRLWGVYNSDLEYGFGARYILTKYISLSASYDSDMAAGLGLTIIY